MNTSTKNTLDAHQEIQLLLPWYVNQSLDSHDYQIVDQHVKYCLLCRRELVSLRKLAHAVTRANDLDIAAETSFAVIANKLPARGSKTITMRTAKQQPYIHRFNRVVRHRGFRYAMVASLLLVLMPFGLRMMSLMTDGLYSTLSAARPVTSQTMELRVVFAKSTSVADIDALLKTLHAQQFGEANSVGALTIRLEANDQSSLDQAIAQLRSRQDVLLAEPVLQP